jgi:CDP-ribitol ribitolphosphotransferase / teichoic acid ribitol-phosphate polymerase
VSGGEDPIETARPSAGDGGVGVCLESVSWVRVQVIVRVRVDAPGADLADPGLVPVGRSMPIVRPVGHARSQDSLILRFNVMQGPNLDPLAPGTWILTSGGRPVELAAEPGLPVALEAATFDIPQGTYRVAPEVDASSRLLLHVELGRKRRARRTAGPSGTVARERPSWMRPLLPAARSTPARAVRRAGRRALQRARVRRLAFRLAFALFGAIPRGSRRRAVFVSSGHVRLGGNLKTVHDRMVERGLDRSCHLAQLHKPPPGRRRTVGQWLGLAWLLARADVVLVAGSRERSIYEVEFGPDVRIVQLWHASGAFKTVGYSRIGKPGGPDPYSRIHKNYTHAIVSSTHDVPFYAEAFGIPEDRLVPIGIPRMDRFFDPGYAAVALRSVRRHFPMVAGRRVILFAPTYRGRGASDGSYRVEQVDLRALHALCEELDSVAIVKMHPFVRAPVAIPAELADRIVDATRTSLDVNDLLFGVDVLVTDYSSIMFEFAALGRPMVFYAPDLEEYVAGRDFYVPFEQFVPGPIVRTFADLLDAVRRAETPSPATTAFAKRHFAHLDAGSTDRVIDELVLAP